MVKRRKSDLAVFERLSPNKTKPRNKAVRRITPHCMAGNLTADACLGLSNFQTPGLSNSASVHYAIGSNGRIGLGLEETSRSWTSSSAANDHEAITMEIANIGGAPDWRMSDEAINAWLDLITDIAKHYEFKQVVYQPKPANVTGSAAVESWITTWAGPGDMIVTLHNWYAAKACPGPYFMRQLPWLVREINKRLQGLGSEKFVGEGAGTVPVILNKSPFEPYMVTINTTALNVRKGPGVNTDVVKTLYNDKNIYTIVDEADGIGSDGKNTRWGKLKSGIGWIGLSYTKKK